MRGLILFYACICICFAEMDKYVLNKTYIDQGAVCLDGSDGIYYYKAGSETNSTKWVFHIMGGGLCMNKEECLVRSKMFLGTSTVWPDTMSWGGPIDENPEKNPDFYDWSHAFFAYCDGGSFSGDRNESVAVGNETIYFRGYRILRATIQDLLATKGLDHATDVLVVGDSAGAMALYYHIDEIKSMMPASVTRFKAIPFSGIFLDRPNIEGKTVFSDGMKTVFNDQQCKVNDKCVAAQSPEEAYKCFFAEHTIPFIETPLFVVNSQSDLIGVECVALGEPLLGISGGTGNCSAVPGWQECMENNSKCTEEQWLTIEEYPKAFRSVVDGMAKLQVNGNGLYEYSCFNHDEECSFGWNNYVVNGTVLREAAIKWFFSDNEPASEHTYKDCVNHLNFSCNPTCIPPPPQPSSSHTSSSSSSSSSTTTSSVVPPSSSTSPSTSSTTPTSSTTSTSSKLPASSSSILYPMVSVVCALFIALLW